MTALRITFVISSMARGGAERVASTLMNAWAERGIDVTLLTFDSSESAAYPLHPAIKRHGLAVNWDSRHFLEGLFRNLKRILTLRQAIRQSQPDIVVSFIDQTNVLTLLATRGLGKPIVVSERVDPSCNNVGWVWNTLRSLIYPSADALVCQTASVLEQFQKIVGSRGCIIPNPLTIPPASRDPWREKASRTHTLVAMGRLVPQKGFDLLLSAFAQVAELYSEWSLKILGQGPLRSQLETQASDLKLATRVQFVGEVSDPFSVLCAADLFVLSSRAEGFPMALCEAMVCGLPVVSFDCPSGPRDIIRDGVDGILVPPADVNALASALSRLMGNAQERESLAGRAPEVLERFSLKRILDLWQELFDTVIGRSNAKSLSSAEAARQF